MIKTAIDVDFLLHSETNLAARFEEPIRPSPSHHPSPQLVQVRRKVITLSRSSSNTHSKNLRHRTKQNNRPIVSSFIEMAAAAAHHAPNYFTTNYRLSFDTRAPHTIRDGFTRRRRLATLPTLITGDRDLANGFLAGRSVTLWHDWTVDGRLVATPGARGLNLGEFVDALFRRHDAERIDWRSEILIKGFWSTHPVLLGGDVSNASLDEGMETRGITWEEIRRRKIQLARGDRINPSQGLSQAILDANNNTRHIRRMLPVPVLWNDG